MQPPNGNEPTRWAKHHQGDDDTQYPTFIQRLAKVGYSRRDRISRTALLYLQCETCLAALARALEESDAWYAEHLNSRICPGSRTEPKQTVEFSE